MYPRPPKLLPAFECQPFKDSSIPSTSADTMNRCPPEIKRSIAFHLRNHDDNLDGPRDIKSFRLVNKEFSDIGAEFLLPVIHLTFQTNSFERLQTISQHSFYSKRVTHLLYKPDAFDMGEEDRMKQFLRLPKTNRERGELANDCKLEEMDNPVHDQWLKFYTACKAIVHDQTSIRDQIDSYNCSLLAGAIALLPNLTEVTLSFENAFLSSTNAFRRAYRNTIHLPKGDNGHKQPYGVMQLYSVLSAVASAETKLKTLNCGKIDWKLLKLDEDKTKTIKSVMKNLEALRIIFSVGEGYLKGLALESEVEKCGAFLTDYRMCDLLSAATDLKIMSLYVERSGRVGLQYMVGTTTWASLRSVDLDSIFVAEVILIGFLKRHTATLKELGLNHIVIIDGSWISALPAIRDAVKLKEFRALGAWITQDPFRHYPIDTSMNCKEVLEARMYGPPSKREAFSNLWKPQELGMAVGTYLILGGTCPKLDNFRNC